MVVSEGFSAYAAKAGAQTIRREYERKAAAGAKFNGTLAGAQGPIAAGPRCGPGSPLDGFSFYPVDGGSDTLTCAAGSTRVESHAKQPGASGMPAQCTWRHTSTAGSSQPGRCCCWYVRL